MGSVYPTTQGLRAAVAKQADASVARVVVRRVDGVSPCVGICLGGRGYENYGGPLIGNIKREQNS